MANNNEEVEDYVVFTDAEGVERKFAPIYELDYEDNSYVLLEPIELFEGIEEGEVIICRIEFADDENDDDYSLVVVEDEKEADAVFKQFIEEVESEEGCDCGCEDCGHDHHHCDCGCDDCE